MPTEHVSRRIRKGVLPCLFFLLILPGCFDFSSSEGGGQTDFTPPRRINPQDISLPAGYQIEVVTTGLTFPTGVTVDQKGNLYVVKPDTPMEKFGPLHDYCALNRRAGMPFWLKESGMVPGPGWISMKDPSMWPKVEKGLNDAFSGLCKKAIFFL